MPKRSLSVGLDSDSIEANPSLVAPAENPFAQYAFQSPRPPSRRDRPTVNSPLRLSPSKRTLAPENEAESSVVRSPSRAKKIKVPLDLPGLSDHLAPNLDIVFCGINPGAQSAQVGHHYAGPTNHFWTCLHESGLTSRKMIPREDAQLPVEFNLGLTNLVARPTVEQSDLHRRELSDGVPLLLDKIAQYAPRVVCFVGLGIADIVRVALAAESVGKASLKVKASVGLQPYKAVHEDGTETLFYAVSSTSGRVVRYQKKNKIVQFSELHTLLNEVKSGAFDTMHLVEISSSTWGEPHADADARAEEAAGG